MGLQNHTLAMTARCVAFGFDAWSFVNYLQDGFTKPHAGDDSAMRCSRSMDALYFVKYLQDGLT